MKSWHARGAGTSDVRGIVDSLKLNEGLDVKYGQGKNMVMAKSEISPTSFWDEIEQLPAYLAHCKELDPGGTYEVISVLEDDVSRFLNCYLATSTSKRFWAYSRKIPVDSTFVKTTLGGMWFGAIVKDANEQLVLLAQGYAGSETKDSWLYFLGKLQSDFPDASVVMSDKSKGGCAALNHLGYPTAVCAFHMEGNIKTSSGLRHNPGIHDLIWMLAAASSEEEFISIESKAREEMKDNEKTIDYIVGRKAEFASYVFLSKDPIIVRYGDATSNAIESMNKVILKARHLPLIRMLQSILRYEAC